MLARLNPLRGVDNKREVWAWAMYDLANQSFTVLINTVFFAVYFQERLVGDPARGNALWGQAVAISNALVLLTAPALGAMADHAGTKKRWLFALYAACVALTAALALPQPGSTWMVWAAFALYVGANWAFAAGESFIGAFLPEIATPRNVGRVSAFGWSLGYVGTLLVLPASLLITGVGAFSNGDYRRVFVFAAAWFLVMAIPTFAVVRERPAEVAATEGRRPGAHLVAGLLRLRDTFLDAARHRRFLRFLAVFTVYSCGTQAVIYFATIVAKDRFGFDDVKRVLFMLQLGATAGLGALIAGAFQDRAGHRATLAATLALWVVATAGALATPMEKQFEWAFWLVGNMVGLALGAIGTASRAFAGSLTPLGKTAEFFGLWSMAYRAAGVAGPWAFGIVSRGAGINAGLLLVIGFFALGLVGMLTAREDRPARA